MVQPRYSPVHPGPWTGVNRGVPGAQWDWGIRWEDRLKIDVRKVEVKYTEKDNNREQWKKVTKVTVPHSDKLPASHYRRETRGRTK